MSIIRSNQRLNIVRAGELVLDRPYHVTDSNYEEFEEEKFRELTEVNEICETYQDQRWC
jgi:hypothetical protein